MKLLVTKPEDPKESRMDVHQNARLTPRCRELLVAQVLAGRCRRTVARELGVSEKTVQKWVGRFQREGITGPREYVAEKYPATFRIRLPADGSRDRFELDWGEVRSYARRVED
jgi:transposase-like protein